MVCSVKVEEEGDGGDVWLKKERSIGRRRTISTDIEIGEVNNHLLFAKAKGNQSDACSYIFVSCKCSGFNDVPSLRCVVPVHVFVQDSFTLPQHI